VRVWHDPSTVQVGLQPTRGVLLTGLVDGDDVLLGALDGRHALTDLRVLAQARGLPGSRADDLVDLLHRAGVLRDAGPARVAALDRAHLSRLPPDVRTRLAPDADAWSMTYPDAPDGQALLARRAGARVLVDGLGRVASAVAATLAQAGVGTVGRAPPSGSATQHEIVVLVRDDAIDVRVADPLVRRDVAHLAVVEHADRVVVGPLVLPGDGPCLRCLDLHRCDRDPTWSHASAQVLAAAAGRDLPSGRAETAIAVLAAGLAAGQVLLALDGVLRPVSHGRTLDVVLPDGLIERRRWATHPSCGCARWPGPLEEPPDGPPDIGRTGATTGAPLRPDSGCPMMDA
jgi:hypothetical protein